jgi:RNA ligase (TIGR02306 family)
MKMAGVYSEGLVLPVNTNVAVYNMATEWGTPDGYDVSELMGATKYDPEGAEEQKLGKSEKKSGAWYSFLYRFDWIKKLIEYFRPVCKYSWPEWASKSDETRVQNLNYVYQKYQGQRFYATEKLDGQSCLYAIHKGKFYVGSRNLLLARPGRGIKSNNYWDFALKHDIEAKMRKIRKEVGRDFYIQGELCGPGIQGNKYALREKEFFVYNMRLIGANRYVARHAIEAILGRFRIKTVPLLGLFTWKFGSIDELLKYADGTSVITPGVLREGVVIRSCDDRGPDTGQSNQLSFKVISPSFDLKWSNKP